MAKARGITKRRKAVQNIRKITRTMQLIATARFQRAFNRAVATRPYTNKLTELVRDLAATQEQIEHPLLQVNSGTGRSILLVLTSNRGLCGGYNAGLLREQGAPKVTAGVKVGESDVCKLGRGSGQAEPHNIRAGLQVERHIQRRGAWWDANSARYVPRGGREGMEH